jgi:CrcB protein
MSLLVAVMIGAGGGMGALARAFAGRWIRGEFPLATLLVNVTGSFLLALAWAGLPGESELLRAVIGSGFCGAFTTFSTFVLEVVLLMRAGQRSQALLYLGLTLCLCCLASWGGFSLMS